MNCSQCGAHVPDHVDRCTVCGSDVGFPNVRAAETVAEQTALAARLQEAKTSASARGALSILEDFGGAVQKSQAVLARPLGYLDSLVKSTNALYISFHSQVRSGARVPENNDWDKGRAAAEATVHPFYFEKINYTALSLDGFGVRWWGDYSISLKELHVSNRTSVFEENPFLFCERHRVIAGKPAPAGFRATWAKRPDLAMAKLVDKLSSATQPKDYPSILLDHAASRAEADFIECHTYGPVHPTSIERVRRQQTVLKNSCQSHLPDRLSKTSYILGFCP